MRTHDQSLSPDDWARLIEPVARALWPDAPFARTSHGIRFGTHGSLSVDVDRGVYYDHENGRGGGVLAMVEHALGTDRAGALEWLEGLGFIPARRRERAPLPVPRRARFSLDPKRVPAEAPSGAPHGPVSGASPGGGGGGTDPQGRQSRGAGSGAAVERASAEERAAFARLLWSRARPAADTAGHRYLELRACWPGHVAPAPSVRWLSRERAPAAINSLCWYGLPRGACGALAFAWCALGEPRKVRGVSLLAVGEGGGRIGWFENGAVKVCAVGERKGLVFVASRGEGPVHAAEGECDALALANAVRGTVTALGSTAGMRSAAIALAASTHVLLHPDADAPGESAAAKAHAELAERGIRCDVHVLARGDPADAVRDAVEGSANYLVRRDGAGPAEALRQAWDAHRAARHERTGKGAADA